MELEELQKAWKELNERVNQNELVHQQQIIEMLSRQKESCLQRMLRLEKGGFCFLLGITLLILMDFIYLKGQLVFWQATFGIFLWNLALCFDSKLYRNYKTGKNKDRKKFGRTNKECTPIQKVISLGLYYRIPNCYHIPRCIFL